MSGTWVFVCGASGAGKDSVMGWAAQQLARQSTVVFARRLVTRAPQDGSDHDPVTAERFEQLLTSGNLAWHWAAHGFKYGIDARYRADVAAGRTVVVNGSREHASALPKAANVRVVHIVAERAQLAERLARRGRDAPDEVAARLERNARFEDLQTHHTIVNQGALADAGQQLALYLAPMAHNDPYQLR